MTKKLLMAVAVLALAFPVNAQVKNGSAAVTAETVKTNGTALKAALKTGKANAPKKEFTVDTDEHIMGYYDTDDLPDILFYDPDVYGYGYLGFPTAPGEISVANAFEPDMIGNFVGGEITKVRYAIADPTTVIKKVFIREIDSYDDLDVDFGTCVAEVDMDDDFTAELGWNDITLDDPVTIKENKIYVIGYTYTQTMVIYPIVTDELLDVDDYDCTWHFVAYGNSYWSYGSCWYGMNEDSDGYEYGHLCLQAVVRGGTFAEHDINLRKLDIPKYAGLDKGLSYSFQIRNYGSEAPTTYEVSFELNGDVIKTLTDPVTLTNSYQTISGTLDLPKEMDVTGESSTLKIYISKFNNATPEEGSCTQTLEGSFVVYDVDVDRQMHLVEQFTSTYCGNCPLGHATLEALMEQQPGKYAWVAVHGKMMDETSGGDPYALEDGVYIDYFYEYESYLEYFLDVEGYPYASFDRVALNSSALSGSENLSIGIGWDEAYQELAAQYIDAAVDAVYEDIPAFVPVDIAVDYNSSTNKLYVTVSGTGVNIAKTALANKVLYVYLLEDGITGRQEDYYNDPQWIEDYTHDNVLRCPLSYYYGDDILWTSDAAYSNSYAVTLDDSWVLKNLKIVAFVAGPVLTIDSNGTANWGYQEDAYVNNANELKLSDTPAGISAIASETGTAEEVARYAVSGTQLSAPAKGVNIVKMSDGSVKKIVVK